jgi:hypothetical protein
MIDKTFHLAKGEVLGIVTSITTDWRLRVSRGIKRLTITTFGRAISGCVNSFL